MGSTLVTDEKLQQVLLRVPPCALVQAYGPHAVAWARKRPPVWAWVSWPHKPAERVEAWAEGWNGRVVFVRWNTAAGDVSTVVWRNTVTKRTT